MENDTEKYLEHEAETGVYKYFSGGTRVLNVISLGFWGV